MAEASFSNPFRPGAGHMPPYLAGRENELQEFRRLLKQDVILENLVLTGLRGVGKTVLLETFKPLAITSGWFWVGADLSESASLTEDRIATRLMADLSVVTSTITVASESVPTSMGFDASVRQVDHKLDYKLMTSIYEDTPGISSDKIKAVLEIAWESVKKMKHKGIIFAYDEAQNLSDHADRNEYPLSLLLDVFQSIQRKGVPFMLALTGLPTLFPKLVEARTFAERMFRVVFLDRLKNPDSFDAIRKPIQEAKCPVTLADELVDSMVEISGGYPYFIQFLGREVFDLAQQVVQKGKKPSARNKGIITIPFEAIIRKLDTDFFAGRWAKATDRQRALLTVIAHLDNCDSEFSVLEITEKSKDKELLPKPFSPSHVNQMLADLGEAGLIYKNRYGKYSFAVPLLGQYIKRQIEQSKISPRRD
jgi:hypothetical protein